MDLTAGNTNLWNPIIQFGIIAGAIIIANFLRRRIPVVRKSLMPTAVLGGFIVLLLKSVGVISIDPEFFEMLTYHGIAIGFIAMSLRVSERQMQGKKGDLVGLKSGAMIVGTYMVQAIVGLVITVTLSYTVMPGFFKAAGLLLPMGYGQGPGQANNVGSTYEGLGFVGGRSFGLAIAASGYLCACIVGVIVLNVLNKRGRFKRAGGDEVAGSVTVDTFQDQGEIPISQSLDKLSMQVALVLFVYLLTYLATWGLTSAISLIDQGIADMVSSLIWGFNFIIGSLLAMGVRSSFKFFKKHNLMTRQYQNNYLLSRLSGLAFDLMIVAGIGSINIGDLSGYWLPFILLSVAGAVVTYIYLYHLCKKAYPRYYYEGLLSMYGMMTGTISSGVLLLREIDPEFKTPAANNLVIGSSFGIAFGAPLLVFISLAVSDPQPMMLFITMGILAVYGVILTLVVYKAKGRKSNRGK